MQCFLHVGNSDASQYELGLVPNKKNAYNAVKPESYTCFLPT